MEKIPQNQENAKESILVSSREEKKNLTTEFAPIKIEGDFTVDSFSKVVPAGLKNEDKMIVLTESGNRYFISQSKSRPGLLKFINEKTGDLEYIHPQGGNKDLIIEVGKVMDLVRMVNPDDYKEGGTGYTSTEVSSIDVWRNLGKAVKEVEKELSQYDQKSGLASGIINTVNQKVAFRDYRVKN